MPAAASSLRSSFEFGTEGDYAQDVCCKRTAYVVCFLFA